MTDSPIQSDLARLAALPDRLRLALSFDAEVLANELAGLGPEAWTQHFVPENYEGDWSVLPLRAPRGVTHPILRITSNPGAVWEDTELLSALPGFGAVRDSLNCEVTAMRLMRLGPGSRIKEHCDADLSADFGTARLHIPIMTNPEVDFRLAGEAVTMAAGECWYLQLSRPHSVANLGTTERTHLVIDAQVNRWLAGLLLAAAQPAP